MEQLRKKYEAQADLMSTKPRFGYFSILPSHTAGKTDFDVKKCYKNQDGRVATQNRNIFSGATSSGITKKSYFSVPKSIYHGDPYDKPHNISQSHIVLKNGQKQVYKPAKLNKTLAWPSYKYQSNNAPAKDPKINRRPDGSVVTQQRNIFSNCPSKIYSQHLKKFNYTGSDYDNQRKLKNIQNRNNIQKRKGEGPFKSGSPVQEYFSSNLQIFNDHEIKANKKNLTVNKNIVNHEVAFRPNCRSKSSLFSYPKHMPQNQKQIHKKKLVKKQEPFRLSNKKQSSKPCPSISYSRTNLFRKIR